MLGTMTGEEMEREIVNQLLWFGQKLSSQKTHVLKVWFPMQCSEEGFGGK
jgi:hypothetical protein